MAFDLMPTDTEEQWANISARLAKVAEALDGVRASLLSAADAGNAPALRQVTKVADQAETWAGLKGEKGFFESLVAGAPEALRADLEHGARSAQESYADLAGFLRAELAPKARTKDAVGEDTYRLWSRYFIGAALDPREAYDWGWGEFFRLEKEMREVAARLKPGATLTETAAALDADPRYRVRGKDEFRQWMQDLSDDALKALRGKHFEIPDELMALDCRIAPPGGGAGRTTRARARTSRGRARCGGRCHRGAPSSPRGARSAPSTTKACRGITCRSGRPCTSSRSTGSSGCSRSPPGTAKAGRCTPSG